MVPGFPPTGPSAAPLAGLAAGAWGVERPAGGRLLLPPAPISASWLVIQWRTSNSIRRFGLPGVLNSYAALRTFGVSWSSSNMKWPPMADTFVGKPTPRPQRAGGAATMIAE